jgi:late competence protein required for DNA uptake (superfamily II DNA/RNA helicase)
MTVPTKKDKTMLKKFCHDQVKILLERMDTHPEEFLKEGKWDDFLPSEMNAHRALLTPRFKHFTKLEQYLVRQKYKSMVQALLRQRAYDGILETLVFKEETNTERYYSTSNQPVLGTPTIYEATVDAKTGKMTEKITRIKSK